MRAESKWGDAARGFSAVVALGILLIGVPLALAALVGWPLPRAVPAWSEISSAFGDSYIPDSFLVKAVALGCWLVWLELAASVVVESVALAKGRAAAHVPLAGPLQRMAGRLVASMALLVVLVASRPEATPLRPLSPAPVAVSALQDAVPVEDSDPALTATETERLELSYTVKRRDTLWGISEAHLQDPYRWSEIWALNQGRPQADGSVPRDPGHIHTGWVLRMPPDAVGLTPPPAPAPPPSPEPAPVSSTEGVPEAPAEVMVPLSPTDAKDAHVEDADEKSATVAASASAAPAREYMVPVPDAAHGQGGGPGGPLMAGTDPDDALPEAAPAGIRSRAEAQRSAWGDALRRRRDQP